MPVENFSSYRVEVPEKYSEVLTHFYVARNDGETNITRKLIPSFLAVLVFNFGTPLELIGEDQPEIHAGNCFVLGPIKKQLHYVAQPGCELLVVNFKDDAFYRFFGNVILEMNAVEHPDILLGTNCFEQLWERLSEMNATEERIQALLQFCDSYVKERNPIAAQLAAFNDETQSEVKAVAADMNVSERTVQKEYKKQFGFTSKEKQRHQRFLKTISEVQSSQTKVDWQDIAYRFGYYDQSHLIQDFNYYLGVSPEQYLKSRSNTCLGNP
jgi:AraC-like DNA-binding protein